MQSEFFSDLARLEDNESEGSTANRYIYPNPKKLRIQLLEFQGLAAIKIRSLWGPQYNCSWSRNGAIAVNYTKIHN
jgi:hypothetical protein